MLVRSCLPKTGSNAGLCMLHPVMDINLCVVEREIAPNWLSEKTVYVKNSQTCKEFL